jgi:hypothetical protein
VNGWTGGGDKHLTAQIVTAALSATCLQFNPTPGGSLPRNGDNKLGNPALAPPPAPEVANLDRRDGKYRLSAVQARKVSEPEKS